MEDDEDTKTAPEPSSTTELNGSSSDTEEEKKQLETVGLSNTEQCDFVPDLGDSKSPLAAAVCVPKLDDSPLVVAEEVVSSVGDKVEESVSELDKSIGDDKSPNDTENIEAVVGVEEETLVTGADAEQLETGLEDNTEVEGGEISTVKGAENGVLKVNESEVVSVKSPIVDELAVEETEVVGVKSPVVDELAVEEMEVVGVKSPIVDELSLEETEIVGVKSPIVDELAVEETEVVGVKSPVVDELAAEEEEVVGVKSENVDDQMVGTEMEVQNEVVVTESGVEKEVSELEDTSIAPEDEEAMAEGGDVEMETETEMANEDGIAASVLELENLDNVDTVSPVAAEDDEDDEDVGTENEIPLADAEMEMETDVAEMAEADKGVTSGGKRKRGRSNSKVPAKAPARKVIEEDVCFICFDGGDLVLCDRRGCPKAYHPSCVNREEAFFRAKGRWNCGWHLCSKCEKNAHYMCYTCTFSLCKTCIKDAVILCIRGNKGFCETCIEYVKSIENNEQANKDLVDFDDKSSWLFLFKDYWIDLKAKLSLSSVELAQAKNPWKGSDVTGKRELPEEVFDANNEGSGSDNSENLEANKPKRRKPKKKSKSTTKENDLPSSTAAIGAEGTSISGNTEWASKELLEFVMHMKNGDRSVLSQFDVQALLLEYIKRNKLRDPRKKSQIICDTRLENLFGKARVGHFEMLKLLESHFLIKEDSQTDDNQGTVVDNEISQLEADGTIDAPTKGSKDRRRKRKKGDERGLQSNLDDFAAIDMHNISLIYLRRKLVEDLLEDIELFQNKVDGTFVRIRISGSNQKQDMYRLVRVVGTRKAAGPYKVGKKTTDLVLEILNLNKTEVVSIDTISNQEFTEDECKRLRQSIKCGLIKPLTVGNILDKAMEVQAARVNDWLESETVRLSHLRDRASEKGRRKELRECVEKLQLLKTPDERQRRLEEIPEINADPNMDPDHESEEDDGEMEENKQEIYTRSRGSGFSRKGKDPISPRGGSFPSADSWSGSRKNSGKNWELNRNVSFKDYSNKGEEATTLVSKITNDNTWNQGRDKDLQQANNTEMVNSATNSEAVGLNAHSFGRSDSFSGAASGTSQASVTAGAVETDTKISETEKMWHYKDPSGKVQGPFSIVQLRKWNNNGYFPADLRIWRNTETQDDSILLTNALAGRFQKELALIDNNSSKAETVLAPRISSTNAGRSHGASLQGRESESGERLKFDQVRGVQSQLELSSSSGWGTPVQTPKLSAERWGPDYSRNDSFNLPSPTPKSSTPGWAGGSQGGNGPVHSPAVATSDGGQLTHSAASSSFNQNGSKEPTAMESLGVSAHASVLNSGRQLIRGFENDSSNSLSSPTPKSEQVVLVGSTPALPTSQTIVTDETHGWGSGSVQNQEMVAPIQPAGCDPQVWGGVPSQKLEPNPSLPVPVQPAAYGQWGGPPAVQNPSANFSTPGYSAMPQTDPWRPPVAGNQSNIQSAAPPTMPWGMGVPEQNSFAPGLRPDNANTVWVPVQGNPNMGWIGPAPGTTNMNWGPVVQAPFPGPVNPGWVAPPGNPGAMVQGQLPPGNANPGWATQPINSAPTVQGPGNVNSGWVAPTGNPGGNVQGPAVGNVHPGWGPPSGNPGNTAQGPGPAPGNANPGWGPLAGNPGMRGNEKQHGGDRYSGQRDRGYGGGGGGGRKWNKQPRVNVDRRGVVCPYHKNGSCYKGDKCDMLHS